MTYHEIKMAIVGMTDAGQLSELSELIQSQKTNLGKATLSVGDKVWCVQKTKRTAGIVTKINTKKAVVDMKGRSYNVPFSMLTARF
jgi:hypothetical protein